SCQSMKAILNNYRRTHINFCLKRFFPVVNSNGDFAPALLYPTDGIASYLVFRKDADYVIGACLWRDNAKANAHVERAVHLLAVNPAVDLNLPEYAHRRRQAIRVVPHHGVQARQLCERAAGNICQAMYSDLFL